MDSVAVPGDFSSAAFFIVAALLIAGLSRDGGERGTQPHSHGAAGGAGAHGGDHRSSRSHRERDCRADANRSGRSEPVGRSRRAPPRWSRPTSRPTRCPMSSTSCRSSCSRPRKAEGRLAAAGRRGTAGQGERPAAGHGRAAPRPWASRSWSIRDGMDVVGDPNGWAGGRIATEGDHRVAMVGAIAGAASRGRDDHRRREAASRSRILGFVRDLESVGDDDDRRHRRTGRFRQEHHRPGSGQAPGHALSRHRGHVPHRHPARARSRAGARSHPGGGGAGGADATCASSSGRTI